MFSVRIVTTDHYQSLPIPGLDVQYSDFRGSDVWKVPVVRIYGSTPGGQKTCMHVHGVFPYLYVPYDGTQPWDRYLRLFANSLDKALNVSLNNANSKTQHVYKINLVSGIPMYGYHDKEEQFLKIFFYNPGMIRKAADLLLGGAVMNKAFQPHESHIPYVLQMFIDYNLYGMNMLNVAAVRFRKQKKDGNSNPIEPSGKKHCPDSDDVKSSQGSDNSCPRTPISLFDRSELATPSRTTWDIDNIPEDLYLDECVTRQSTCELECDIVAPDVLNRLEVDANVGTNPGLAALWEDEKQRKRNMGESSQITPPASQEREDVEISESDELFRLKFLQIIQNHQPYMDSQTEDSQNESVSDITTPASALDLQLSQDDMSDASQVTIIVEDEEEDGVKPIISVDSIKRVVSMSQSFSGSQGSQPIADTQDKSLAEILASLANEDSPSSSQEVAGQITALEEKDSILLDKSEPINDEVAKQLEEETLEMSQVVWDSDDKQEEDEKPGTSTAGFDLEGLDDSWNVSQFLRTEESDGNEDIIPQYDGAVDEKPDKSDGETTKKKRLGVSGPVVNQGQGYHSNITCNQSNQYSQHHGYNSNFMYQNWQQPGPMVSPQYQYDNQSNQTSVNDECEKIQSTENTNEGRSNPDLRHFHGNQIGISSQYPGNQQHLGLVNNYGNLQSPSHYPSPHSNYGNMQNHGSYSNLSSTSSRSNIQSPHDSSHGSLHSPALSSHSNLQSPSQTNNPINTHDGSQGNIKSPINEDSRDSMYSSKDFSVQPTSQQNFNQQRNVQSLQSPVRHTPSPEVHDDFTVHHFSKDKKKSQKTNTQNWPHNQQKPQFQQGTDHYGNMQSPVYQPLAPSNQRQYHQMSSQHQNASGFHQGQYRGQQPNYSSNAQHVPYNNPISTTQSSYNEAACQPQLFNHHVNQSSQQVLTGQNSQPYSSPNAKQHGESTQPLASPTFQQHTQLPQKYSPPNKEQFPQVNGQFTSPDNQQQTYSGLAGQQSTSYPSPTLQQQGQPHPSPTGQQSTSYPATTLQQQGQPFPLPTGQQQGQPYPSPNGQQGHSYPSSNLQHQGQPQPSPTGQQYTQMGQPFQPANNKQQHTFSQPYQSPDNQQNLQFLQSYMPQTSQQKEIPRVVSESMSQQSSLSQPVFQDSQQNFQCDQSHYKQNPMHKKPKLDNQPGDHQGDTNMDPFPQISFHQLLSEDLPHSSSQLSPQQKAISQSRLSPNINNGNPIRFQSPNQLSNQHGAYNCNDQSHSGVRMTNQFTGPVSQQQSMGGFYPNPQGFLGELNNPRMQIRAKVSRRGRRPKSTTEHNPSLSGQLDMAAFCSSQEAFHGNPGMQVPPKPKRGRKPKNMCAQNPHLNIQGYPQQNIQVFDGSQQFFSPGQCPSMQVPPKPKRGRRPKSMTEPNPRTNMKVSQANIIDELQKKYIALTNHSFKPKQPDLSLVSQIMKKDNELSLETQGQQMQKSLPLQNLQNQQELSLHQLNHKKQEELALATSNLPRIPSAVSVMNDNITFRKHSNTESKTEDVSNPRQATTLERLLLYGEEGLDNNSSNEKVKQKGSQESETSDKLNKQSEISSPQPNGQQLSQSLSPNGSADLFSDSSQSSLSSRPVISTLSNEKSDKKTFMKENENKLSDRSSLSSLASLVGNVSPASSFGYQYDNPTKSIDSSVFVSPEPYNRQRVYSSSQNLTGFGNRSPAHSSLECHSQISYRNKSPSHFGLDSKFSGDMRPTESKSPSYMSLGEIKRIRNKSPSHFGSGNKSPNRAGYEENKSPSHSGFMRSISYDGSQVYSGDGCGSNSDFELSGSQDSNSSYSSHLNNSLSGYSPQNKSPNLYHQHPSFMGSQSFSFDKKVKGRPRKNQQQSRCQSNSVSKKPPPPPNPAYTFTFHVPTPVYKRLKLTHHKKPQNDDIKIVRMHPMDARRYSLLKIGRGIIKVKKLTQSDVDKSGLVLKAPLDELLMAARNTRKRTTSVHRSLSSNSDTKAPYDIKTENVTFSTGIPCVNQNYAGTDNVNYQYKTILDHQNISNKYPQKMIVPPAQVLAESSGDCYTIKKVTLTSIIENVLLTSLNSDNNSEGDAKKTGEQNTGEQWPHGCEKSKDEVSSSSNMLCNDLNSMGNNTSGQSSWNVVQNKPSFESYDSKVVDKSHMNSDVMLQRQKMQSAKDAIIPNQISESLINVMFPNSMARSFGSNMASQDQMSEQYVSNMAIDNPKSESCVYDTVVQPGQVRKKVEKQPRRKNLMLCRKRSMNKMLTSSPSVIDPDLDDQDVILKDVSLIEASEGTLTPIKSRTPVAGRSPIRQQIGDAYKLFDGEFLNLKDDIENKLKDLEAGNGNRIFPNIMSEKESGSTTDTAITSGSSTRTSSRCGSSEIGSSLQTNDADLDKNSTSVVNNEHAQREKAQQIELAKNVSPEKLVTAENIESDKIIATEIISAEKVTSIQNISAENIPTTENISSEQIALTENISSDKLVSSKNISLDIVTINNSPLEKKIITDNMASNEIDESENVSSNEIDSVSLDKIGSTENIFSDKIGKMENTSSDKIDTGENISTECVSSHKEAKIDNECSSESSKLIPQSCADLDTSAYMETTPSVPTTNTVDGKGGTEENISIENFPVTQEMIGLRKRKASSLSSEANFDLGDFQDGKRRQSSRNVNEKENKEGNQCIEKFKGCKQMVVSVSKFDVEKECANNTAGNLVTNSHTNLTVTYGLTKWTKIKSQENSENSSESSQEMTDRNYQPSEIKSASVIDISKASSGYFESFRKFALNGQTNLRQPKKKPSLSMNRKLTVAFLSKRRKQKKKPKITGKMKMKKGLNSIKGLSLLHEATLANLTEAPNLTMDTRSQTDNVQSDSGDEYTEKYADVLYKMALYSSPDTDSLDSIPPQPFSPEELSRDQQGITRSTSDAQSPALGSESSVSPAYSNASSTDNKKSPVYCSCYPKLIIGKENSEWKTKLKDETKNIIVPLQSTDKNVDENKQQDFSDSSSNCEETLSHKKIARKAFVKLKRLSTSEIKKYTNMKLNIEKASANNRKITHEAQSPPDLGPPNIPKYSTGTTMDEFDSPPKLSDHDLETTTESSDLENSPIYQIMETNHNKNVYGDLTKGEIDNVMNPNLSLNKLEADIGMKTVSSSSDLSRCSSNSEGPPIITAEKFENIEQSNSISVFNVTSAEDTSNSSHIEELDKNSELTSNSKQIRNLVEIASSSNSFNNRNKSVIITPKLVPPSWKHVTESALSHGLNLANNQEAFCSNPDDVPDKPREMGGRILKIESNRVSDLTEFSSNVQNDGLTTWRQILSAGDEILGSDNMIDRVNKEPQFRFAIMGDNSVTITPCNPAPTCKTVTDWMIGKKKYKQLQLNGKEAGKTKNEQEEIKADRIEVTEIHFDEKPQNLKCNNILKTVSFSEPCDKKLSFSVCDTDTLTNQKAVESGDRFKPTNQTDQHILRKRESLTTTENQTNVKRSDLGDDGDEDDMIGPSPPESARPMSQINKTIGDKPVKRLRLFSSQRKPDQSPLFSSQRSLGMAVSPSIVIGDKNMTGMSPSLHSTPVMKGRHSDFILPACTPINHLNSQKEFVTPKRIPLSKRTSVGSGKDMRRSLSSQLQQFATPDQRGNISQIDGPTPKNSFGFQVSQQNFQDAKALHEVQNLTVLSMELLAETRGDHLPDPEVDPIQAVFYTILNDVHADKGVREVTGVIMVDKRSAKSHKEQEKLKQQINLKKSSKDCDLSPLTPSSTPGSQKTTQTTSDSTKTQPSSPSPTPGSQKPTTQPTSPSSTPGSQKPTTSKDSTHYTSVQPDSSGPSSSSVSSPKNSGKRKLSPSRSRSPKPASASSKSPVSSSSPADQSNPVDQTILQKSGIDGKLNVTYVESENDLFQSFIDLILRWDPDVFVGYEIQKVSWGYLLQRAAQVGMNLCSKISRIPEDKRGSHFSAKKDEYGADHQSEIHIVGRIVINLWRIMRHEVTLNIYTFENVMYHVLHQRVPQYSFKSLNSWYNHRTHLYRWRVINYFTTRVKANMQIMDQIDLIGKTSEFARVFGIEFYHVLSRGSQYRVESMMLRLAKPMNFIPVSPNVHQRARMRAPECIALTLEPESRFYHDPVVVVDFQSLYPSIMIAYNYDFSTCVGRINLLEKAHEGAIEFGCTHLKIPPSVLKKIKDDVTVSPNGIVFVKQHVRKGIISAMVEEILNTRIMVKKSMKDYKNDKSLHRLLDARQMGLKLIANVTYGYTAANFSGRMPCIEVGDSIVRKARETLDRSIKLVEDTPKWGARVVYGDTDSMFILLKGRSKEDAFKIGYEICDAVTAMHPSPIKLKFEKVYFPCVLQTKKRYVGFSYETPDQKEPQFDAKGIETVRRDACPAVAKILERSIKVLFTTRDVSQVKQYVQNQCRKLMEGKVSMLDLIFAKEYRGMPGYKPGACVPALEIAKRALRQDRRSEPSVGSRVPYVIVYGSPGLPLIQLVKQPSDLLLDPALRINATYYITKQILPPLGRMLSLLGVDVFSWYNDMPKVVRVVPQSLMSTENKKGTISQYFASSNCPVCDKPTNQNICNNCVKDPQTVAIVLNDRIMKWETVYHRLEEICNSCMGTQDEKQPCTSLDCPILYRRNLALQDTHKGTQLREILQKCFDF